MFKKIILDGEVTRWSVNEEGQVRNDETGKFLKGTILHTYRYINFRWSHKQKNKAIYRLVAEAFLPNPENLPYVVHIDGNRLNDKLDNLKWSAATITENTTLGKQKAKKQLSAEELSDEIWIPFRDTSYEISNKGRVKNTKTGYITYGSLADCNYYRANIVFNDGSRKAVMVHQLVYECFISPDYEVINHINGIKTDNRVENLESISHKENMRKAAEETNAWNFRKVAQYDLEGNLIATYLNASDAGRAMGILPGSMRNCIRLRNGRYKNYIFKWVEEDETSKDHPQGVE